jgi:hypothetical protein
MKHLLVMAFAAGGQQTGRSPFVMERLRELLAT